MIFILKYIGIIILITLLFLNILIYIQYIFYYIVEDIYNMYDRIIG